jgi:CysZ protein
LLLVVLSPFLMMPVAAAIISLFLEAVADAVEARHYPHVPKVGGSSLMDGLLDAAGALVLLVAANLLALMLYLVLAPFALFIFWGVNGFLLGREYFTVAAMRRVGRTEAKRLRRRHAGTIFAAGVLMAIPLSVPILNIIVPILGAATFTHIFHRLESSG